LRDYLRQNVAKEFRMSDEPHERYLTRREVVEVIRNELGVPVSESRLDKDAMLGLTPRPVAFFGRQRLYRRRDAISYGKSLLTLTPRRLPGSRKGLLNEAADRGA
jgi:hypothetical protein